METTATYPRTVQREEYVYKGRRVILDTCELFPCCYETMLLYPDGTEIASTRAVEETAARSDFARIRAAHPADIRAPGAPRGLTPPPLSGKYARLRDDLRTAAEAARSAAVLVDDSGTCNCDAAALALPRWRESLVEQAAKEAGCSCSDWTLFGKKRYVFFPRDIPGQAYKRETAAEAMAQKLKDLGYDAFNFSQMD